MKILYFTSTGNCLAVARRFQAEYLSIPQMLRKDIHLVEDSTVGLVYPVYAGSVPGIVRRYLKHCEIRTEYLFVIATYGNAAGGTLGEIRHVLTANGNRADYLTTLLMVDNYLPLFDIRDQIARQSRKKTEENLQRIVREISERKRRQTTLPAGISMLTSGAGAVVKAAGKMMPRLYYVNDSCIGCGLCAQVCPVSNIKEENKGKPVFGSRCESCFACLHNCPRGAIHLRIERSAERYRHPDVTLQDIVSANRQF